MRDSQGTYRYTPRGTTWKPCPACGKEPGSSYKIGSVCGDCRRLLDWAKGEHERYHRLTDVAVRLVPTAAHRVKLPLCPSGGHHRAQEIRHQYDEAKDQLGCAILAILDTLMAATGGAAEIVLRDETARRRLSALFPGVIPTGSDNPHPSDHRHILLLAEHAAAFDVFPAVLDVMIDAAYALGIFEGKELLIQLSSGQITHDQFMQADVRAAQQVQNSAMRAERAKKATEG